jgi:hypothetical protein
LIKKQNFELISNTTFESIDMLIFERSEIKLNKEDYLKKEFIGRFANIQGITK